jgi:hypothetical protein
MATDTGLMRANLCYCSNHSSPCLPGVLACLGGPGPVLSTYKPPVLPGTAVRQLSSDQPQGKNPDSDFIYIQILARPGAYSPSSCSHIRLPSRSYLTLPSSSRLSRLPSVPPSHSPLHYLSHASHRLTLRTPNPHRLRHLVLWSRGHQERPHGSRPGRHLPRCRLHSRRSAVYRSHSGKVGFLSLPHHAVIFRAGLGFHPALSLVVLAVVVWP